MRTRLSYMAALLLAAMLVSCKAPYRTPYEEVLDSRSDVCILVGSRDMIDFTYGPVQTSFNPVKHSYRAGVCLLKQDSGSDSWVEVMEEYFSLMLDAEPKAADEQVGGTLYLRTVSLSRSYEAKFKVRKVEKGLAWLWDDTLKLGVVVRCGAPE